MHKDLDIIGEVRRCAEYFCTTLTLTPKQRELVSDFFVQRVLEGLTADPSYLTGTHPDIEAKIVSLLSVAAKDIEEDLKS